MKTSGVARAFFASSLSLAVLFGVSFAAIAQEAGTQTAADVRDKHFDPSVVLAHKFDMRDNPDAYYVSGVKSQEPWGTCWAFGATAAAESSIFADTGKKVDLSERHLAWFAYTPIEATDDAKQAGEGIYSTGKGWGPNSRYASGSTSNAMSVYASGAGPVLESAWPYRGRDAITELEALTFHPDKWKQTQIAMIRNTSSAEEIAELLKSRSVTTLEAFADKIYAEQLETLKEGKKNSYSNIDDWSIPATDAQGSSVRNQTAGFLVIRAYPDAACPAACSCRTSTCSICGFS